MTWWATALPLVPLLPLAGFATLALARRLPHAVIAVIGAGSVGLAMCLAAAVGVGYIVSGGPAGVVVWRWMEVDGFAPVIGLRLDALAAVFIFVVAGVGFLIHLYSTAFMAGDEGYRRYFAGMNLFVASMLLLVLADNLLLLYLGWEGVGLCSYLLIGHWYRDAANGRAARKAFIVTRVGDAALAVGLFLLFGSLGTLNIRDALARAAAQWAVGEPLAVTAGVLILAGAVGKSAQLPLQTWLPDAMAGPTPVSALIHAATMVTAGVYLIARMHVIFDLAPAARLLVAVVGCATMLLAGFGALAQRDIKRVLAYSTISQIGYMFLALGVGAWAGGVAHFVTHALFKSALFLGAGILIRCLAEGHDLFAMGGLRKVFPFTGRAFLMAALTLAAVPPLTLTFNSKDTIILEAWRSPTGGAVLGAGALLGAIVTAAYALRLFFLAFCGPVGQQARRRPGALMVVPFVLLALLGAVAGAPDLIAAFTGRNFLLDFLHRSLPALPAEAPQPVWTGLEQIGLAAVSLAGVAAAYVLYLPGRRWLAKQAAAPAGAALRRLALGGFGFDAAYDLLLVRPFAWAVRAGRGDLFDLLVNLPAHAGDALHALLGALQTGRLRWYAALVVLGAVVYLALTVLL